MGSISMPQGKGSQMHNRRAYQENEWPEHVDQSRTRENVVIRDENLPDAYNRIFGKSINDYNAKQKRDDRKIPDYLDKIRKSKNGEKPFYEDILQWGKRDDFIADPSLREKAKSALIEYAETFQKRNPNLQLIGAYIHMDEASPHLHFDYIPVASGYSRGMQLRNSLDKALKQQGISPQQMDKAEGRKNNRTMAWKARERAAFAEICRERGLVVDPERESDRPNKDVPEYKAMMDEIAAEKEQERAKMAQELAEEMQRKRQAQAKALAAEKEKAEAEMDFDLHKKDAEYATLISDRETVLENQRTETEQLRAEADKAKAAKEKADKDVQEAQERVSAFKNVEDGIVAHIQRLDDSERRIQKRIDDANHQRLDALRKRDAAVADLDVTKRLQELSGDMMTAKMPEIEVLRETEAKTSVFGKEVPATVTIRREDFENLRQTAAQIALMQRLVKKLETSLDKMRVWAKQAFMNKIDARQILIADKVKEVSARAEEAERLRDVWRQRSEDKDAKIESLSADLDRAKADNRDMAELQQLFPSAFKQMNARKRMRAAEYAYDHMQHDSWGQAYCEFGGKKVNVKWLLKQYRGECQKLGLQPRRDMMENLTRLEHDRDLER